MSRWSSMKDALVVALTSWRLWLVQLLGNAILFLVFLWWLRPHEASGWQLFYSSVAVLLTVAAALVLHGGTLDYSRSRHKARTARLADSFRRALRHLPAILVWTLAFFFLEWLIARLDNYAVPFPGYLRSEFPAWLRRMISEPLLDSIYTGFFWLLRWVFLPGLLLPFALFCAEKGFRGFAALHERRRTVISLVYWIVLLAAALIGVSSTQAIMGWTLDAKTATLRAEEISLFFRLFFAYLLGIFSWLLACSMLGLRAARGSPGAAAQPA